MLNAYNLKKMLIVAMPRTGTTVIQKIMALDMFGIKNFVEPFNNKLGFNPANPKYSVDPYKWTAEQTHGIMKLLAINLHDIDTAKLLEAGNFDHVVLIDRENLTDCCVSLYYAEITQKYHYWQSDTVDIRPFECPLEFVHNWISMYHQYQAAKNIVISSGVQYNILSYEDFMADKIQYIAHRPLQRFKIPYKVFGSNPIIATNLPYNKLCTNYQTVKEQIINDYKTKN